MNNQWNYIHALARQKSVKNLGQRHQRCVLLRFFIGDRKGTRLIVSRIDNQIQGAQLDQ